MAHQIYKVLYPRYSESRNKKAKRIIANKFGRNFEIVKNNYGKPYILVDNTLFPYSITRSQDIEMLVFSTQKNINIGIDIEAIKQRKFGFNFKFMSPHECKYFNQLSLETDRAKFFYSIFSLKEAIAKAILWVFLKMIL